MAIWKSARQKIAEERLMLQRSPFNDPSAPEKKIRTFPFPGPGLPFTQVPVGPVVISLPKGKIRAFPFPGPGLPFTQVPVGPRVLRKNGIGVA